MAQLGLLLPGDVLDEFGFDDGAAAGGEPLDRVGDGVLGGEHRGGGVGLLAGSGDADERYHELRGEDPVDDRVQLGGVVAVEAGGDLGHQPGPVEHLPTGQELALGVQQVAGKSVHLCVGQRPGQTAALLPGVVEGLGQALDAPAVGLELGDPAGHELVGAGAAFDGSVAVGGDVAGPVAGVAGLGQVLGDLVGALGEDLAHLGWDAGDAPVPGPPRRAGVGLDGVAQLDGLGRGPQPSDHRRGFGEVSDQGRVQALVPAVGVAHLAHVGDEHVVVQCGVTEAGGAVAGDGVDETGRGGGAGGAAPAAAPGLHPGIQVAKRAGRFGVQDGVHVIGPAHHSQQRQRLVGRDDQLETRPFSRHELLAGQWVPEPARPERQPVRLGCHLAVQAETFRAGAAPAQWRLPPGAVVVQGLARMIVLPAQDRRLVVGHLLHAHHREPRHSAALPSPPPGLK